MKDLQRKLPFLKNVSNFMIGGEIKFEHLYSVFYPVMYEFISEQSIYQYFGRDEPEIIRDMVQIILETNIKDLKQLDFFYDNADFLTVKRRCHKAKPTMIYIGAQKTGEILEEIERELGDYHELNKNLQIHLIQIEIELNQFLKTID